MTTTEMLLKLTDLLSKIDDLKDNLNYDSIENSETTNQLMDLLLIEKSITSTITEIERVQLAQ